MERYDDDGNLIEDDEFENDDDFDVNALDNANDTPQETEEEKKIREANEAESRRMQSFAAPITQAMTENINRLVEGMRPQEQPKVRQAPATPIRTRLQQMSKDQLGQYLTNLQATDPVAYLTLQDDLQRETLTAAASSFLPVVDNQATLLINDFKADMRTQDKMYPKVLANFEKELGDLDRTLFASQMSDAQRKLELTRRYKSARNDYIEEARAKALRSNPPPNPLNHGGPNRGQRGGGRQGGGGGGDTRRFNVQDNPALLNLAAQFGWTKEEMHDFEANGSGVNDNG